VTREPIFGEPPWADQEPHKPEELLEPTPEEIRNGWTPEALTAYVRERTREALQAKQPLVLPRTQVRKRRRRR